VERAGARARLGDERPGVGASAGGHGRPRLEIRQGAGGTLPEPQPEERLLRQGGTRATIPLDKALFAFLNKGARAQVEAQVKAQTKQQNYTLGIRGLPTEANSDAKLQPHGTRLELHCGASMQSIANYNSRAQDLQLVARCLRGRHFTIEVADLVLTKRYMGPQAFPEFLKNFQGGQRTCP